MCSELLSATATLLPEPMFDAVLIDEAQDLPASFFQMVYRLTREPKRIVWAYDELQKLSELGMATVDELFGKDDQGHPSVALVNSENAPRQDIVLPILLPQYTVGSCVGAWSRLGNLQERWTRTEFR